MTKLTIAIALAALSAAGMFYFLLVSYSLIGAVCCCLLFMVAMAGFVVVVMFARPKPVPCVQCAAHSQEQREVNV